MKRFLLLIALLLIRLTTFAQADQQWITSASGVRARSAPATTGEEVARLPIGTILRQLDSDQREATVSGKKDFWYHVALPNSKDGWVFGSFLTRFDEKRKGEIYRALAVAKVKGESTSFADCADLTRFLAAALPEVTDRATLAELELWRWLALQKAFNNIESDKQQQPDYQRFITANQSHSVYSEPGGLWLVKPDLLWNLQKKYADLPVAETIAWEAATLPLPGECEGDDTCATMYMNQTTGKYLQLYPTGKHANKALDDIIQSVQGINEQMKNVAVPKAKTKQDQQLRQDALAAITKMRTNLAKVTSPKKTRLLQLLAQYEKYYR